MNPMYGLISMAVGVMVLLVVFMVIPMIGASVEDATPAAAPGSQWNSTENTSLPNAANTWGTISGLLSLTAVVMILAGLLQVLMSIGVVRMPGSQ